MLFGDVSVVSSDGGGVGGAGSVDCDCSSARAGADDERKRRGVPLEAGRVRTHRRHALNCRTDGVTDAILCKLTRTTSWIGGDAAGKI